MIRAVLALAAALLSACSASVDGSALPAADPALVSAPPQTGAGPLAVEPGHLEPLALAATDVQTMVGTRPFAVVDPGHKGLFGPTDLVRPECSTWITVGLLTSYTGGGWIDAWVSTMTSGPVVIGDPARRYVGQAITGYPSPEAAKAALARIAAELGKCAQDQYVFNDDTVPSWITDKVVFADPNRVTAYSFELSGENYACAHDSAAKANVVVEMLNCTNKDVVRGETRRLLNAILAGVPG